jgi:hypothetical protein
MISPFGFFSPRTFASSSRAAVAANPEKSDRAIAEEIGVHHSTVNEARKRSTAGNPTVEKRTGRDGKTRRMPQVPRAASVDSSGLYFSRAARWPDLMKTPLGGQTERRRYLHDESNLPTCQGGQTAMNDTSTPTRPAAQVASSPRRRWRVEPTPLSESERMARRARRIRLERAALIVSKTYTDCKSYRQILVTAEPVRRRRLRADGRSALR